MQTRPTGGTRTLPGDWERRGRCKEVGPDVMYPTDDTGEQRRALQVCDRCPVRFECLSHALAVDEKHGTWGGLGEAPRKRLRRYMNGHGVDLMTAVAATRTAWSPSPVSKDTVTTVVTELREMAAALA